MKNVHPTIAAALAPFCGDEKMPTDTTLERCVKVLRSVEWSWSTTISGQSMRLCPVCLGICPNDVPSEQRAKGIGGHSDDCEMSAALREASKVDQTA